ncbi:MAG: aldo/keto reductase, partial [Verrucomicrobiae bacterium]|nr:aldo/keto reductase [Verrucomicrobiae bacterium]
MDCHRVTRREFLLGASAAAAATLLPPSAAWPAVPARGTHADLMALGKCGVKASRLGFGTGSNGGRVQRDLGQDAFTELFRYAFDKGIRYIDTADNYKTHGMVAEAIKGLPREELFIVSKMPWRKAGVSDKPIETIERYLRELGTDYLDCLMIHCATVN